MAEASSPPTPAHAIMPNSAIGVWGVGPKTKTPAVVNPTKIKKGIGFGIVFARWAW